MNAVDNAIARPDKVGTDPMAVDGKDGRLSREKWEKGEEPVSKQQLQSGYGMNEKAGVGGYGRI